MNLKLYETLTAFADAKGFKQLTKLQVYECFSEVMKDRKISNNISFFLSTINKRENSDNAAEMLLAGLQMILPERKERLSEQISLLKSKASDPEMDGILDYLELCRNQFAHYGVIPKFTSKPDLYDEADITEKYFTLGCLILYTAFRCRALYHKEAKFESLKIFWYRFNALLKPWQGNVMQISWFDSCLELATKTLIGVFTTGFIVLTLSVVLFIMIAIGGLGREIASGIRKDTIDFCELNRDEAKEYVMELSKAERAFYISERLLNLKQMGNYYKVGDTIRHEVDASTKELYEMARKEWLPNAHNFWGSVTMTTMGLSHTPVLKIFSQIPSMHLYMKRNGGGKKKSNKLTPNHDTISQYYDCYLICTGTRHKEKAEQKKITDFAREIAKRAKVEYLITAKTKDSADAVNCAKSALMSAGVKSNQIKIIYDDVSYAPAVIRLRIL